MIRWLIPALVSLAACDTAAPYFEGVPTTRVTVDGSVFDVRVRGELAEALRVNPEYAPRFGPIQARAGYAMARVSGCDVVEVGGDQALATGLLSCDGREPDWILLTGPLSYSCVQVGALLNDIDGGPYSEFDCDPY